MARFILYFTGGIVVVLAALLSLEYREFDARRTRFQNSELLRLSLASKAILTHLRESITDIRTITSLMVLRDYIQHESAANRARLEQEFLNFAQNKRTYAQIRYIALSGMERVRVNFDERVAAAAPSSLLQDESNRDYFRVAIRLKANAIFITPLDLNIESEQIERPFKPIIRFAMPVFDTAGQLQGIVVLSYLGAVLLEDFRQFMANSWGAAMMVNRHGHWLVSPIREDEWGFMFGRTESFAKRYPDAWEHIVHRESGMVKTAAGLFLFDTVRPYTGNDSANAAPTVGLVAERFWKIITQVSPQALTYSPMALLDTHPRVLTGLLLLVIGSSAALAWLRTNNIAKASALRESESRLAEAQSIVHTGDWEWDLRNGKFKWSDELYRILGSEPRRIEASYEVLLAAVHPDDRDGVTKAVDATLTRHAPFAIDHRVVRPDDTVRYVHQRGTVQRDAGGEPVRMLGTVQDITERKRAEQALQKSADEIQDLYNSAPCGYHSLDKNGMVIQINDTELGWLGYSRDEIVGKTMYFDLLTPDSRKKLQDTFPLFVQRGWLNDLELDLERRDGTVLPVLVSATAIRDAGGDFLMSRSTVFNHTERKRFEQALRESEERLRELVQLAPDGIFVADLDGRYTDVNGAGCNMLGYTREEIVGKTIVDLIPPGDANRLWQAKEQLLNGGVHVAEWSLRRKDGTYLRVEVSARILPDGRWQGFVRDISERIKAQEQLRQAATVFDTTMEAIVIADADWKIAAVNQAYTNITGFKHEEVVGKDWQMLQSGRHDEALHHTVQQSLERTGQWQGEIWKRRKNGELYPAWENISVVKDDHSRITHYVAAMSDISPIKQAEERLSYLAHHDALTGLPNRLAFAANLEQALERAKRYQRKVALLFLDLDRFKLINDTFGHATGDKILQAVSARLKGCVRGEDTVARLGGDEFVLILNEIARAEDAAVLAGKIIDAIAEPIFIADRRVETSTSIGIGIFPDDALDAELLTKAADAAMYRAKERGRHTYAFSGPQLDDTPLLSGPL